MLTSRFRNVNKVDGLLLLALISVPMRFWTRQHGRPAASNKGDLASGQGFQSSRLQAVAVWVRALATATLLTG